MAAARLSVDAAVLTFAKACSDESSTPERMLLGLAEDIALACDPMRNAASSEECQEIAGGALEGLLAVALRGDRVKRASRIATLSAAARVVLGSAANAANAASSLSFEPAVAVAFRPIHDFGQQEEVLAAMQLLQAVAATVPEAQVVRAMVSRVVCLLVHTQEGAGHAPCDAVRAACLEFLCSCALSRSLRQHVARALPPATVRAVAASTLGKQMLEWLAGLLFAALSDLAIDWETGGAHAFGEFFVGFWQESRFFEHLGESLEESLAGRDFPPGSGVFHKTCRLAVVVQRLAFAGFHEEVVLDLGLALAKVVARRSGGGPDAGDAEGVDADTAAAARSAATALLYALKGAESSADFATRLCMAEETAELHFGTGLTLAAVECEDARSLLDLLEEERLSSGACSTAMPCAERLDFSLLGELPEPETCS